MNLRYLNIFLSLALLLIMTGCRDDELFDPKIGEGMSNVRFSMEFEKMYVGLDNYTRSPGDAVKKINNITVVAYDSKGELYKVWRSDGVNGDFSYTISNNTDMPGDFNPVDNEHQAEAKTPKADFTLSQIPFGRYSFYAIANLQVTDEEVATPEQMKEIMVTWQDNVADNNAMFGFFSTEDKAGVRPQSFDAPKVVINRADVTLWAWIKRTVSKVTVAFDGRRLNQNVTIYLKDVQIRDIPRQCYLGKNNTPDAMDQLIKEGETITYEEGTAYGDAWKASVTKGKPIYGARGRYNGSETLTPEQQIEWQHSETAPALYFFENMQGQGVKGTASDKRQDVNGNNNQVSYPNGNNPDDVGFKDAKRYGTYIEVHAYYVNTSSGNNSSGDIIYRFMLGQDDWIDYDALRNRHYKLTMSFNGNANDVDWHIVYTQPNVSFPRPYYISYLYNHRMYCPVTINTGKSTLDSISTRIVSNNWGPTNPGNYIYWSAMNVPYQYQYNGFLSLRKTLLTVLTEEQPFDIDKNKDKYQQMHRGWRVYRQMTDGAHYDVGLGEVDDTPEDKYYVKHDVDKDGNNIYEVSLPMYTRAKQLIKQTAYTGNNPYVAYMRDAKVQLTAHLSDGSKIAPDSTIDIRQVKRVVNPKGIFRKWDSKNKFHVVLKCLPTENASSFETVSSEGGPWKAYVIRTSGSRTGTDDDGNIKPSDAETTEDANGMLTFSGGARVWKSGNTNVSDTVYGDTGSDVDFYINFNNICSNKEKSRHAVVRVEYNNNTCYHLIYVRQGGAPVRLVDNGTKWHTGNMISKSKEADNPLDEGSLFKFGNWDYPIASSCNVNNFYPWINIVPDSFTGNNGSKLTIVGKTGTYKWSDFEGTVTNNNTAFGAPGSGRIAEYKDFYALYKSEDIEQGFGVLYGDAAVETGTTLKEVYGYYTGQSESYGMRGCFVYNKATGVNLFFPIGNSGYGHRKHSGDSSWGKVDGVAVTGLLRYSCNGRWGYFPLTGTDAFLKVYPEGVNDCPLFYDIFMRAGAIYWLGVVKADTGSDFPDDTSVKSNISSWDFNYFTFDFYPLSGGNVQNGKDACFVRCVSD